MKTDVLIVGGGPGGSAAAMFLLKEGVKPIILEQEEFPRFHIGESMTGGATGVMRRLGLEEEMQRRAYPVKYGVRVIGSNSWFIPVQRRDENWELQPDHTWQVRRSDFDQMMLAEAVKRGATLVRGRAMKPLLKEDGTVTGVTMRHPDGRTEDIESTVLLDCSGMGTFLANQKVTGQKYVGSYDKQIAFFTHVTDVVRDSGDTPDMSSDNTLIFYQKKFHWAWFIPVDDKVTSIGVVVPRARFLESKKTPQEFFIDYLPQINEDLAKRVPNMKLVEKVHVIPNYSYQVHRFCGKGFICIGDSHRFIDPIFSLGLSLTMLEAEMAVPHVLSYLRGERREMDNPFVDHMRHVESGSDNLEDILDLFWEQPYAFATFAYGRYRPELIDAFGCRVYPDQHQPTQAMLSCRKLLQRERNYDHEDNFSRPIGSRFHPERDNIWEVDTIVETTENWLKSNIA